MSKLDWIGLAAAIIVGSACSGSNDSGAGGEQIGTAEARISVVPAAVGCIRIVAAGTVTVTRDFAATPGQGAILALSQLPTGNVTFSGRAFNAACSSSLDPATASWVTDPVTTVVAAGAPGNVALTFRMNGGETVTGNFDDGSDGGTSHSIVATTWDPKWSGVGVTFSNGNLSISGNSAGTKNVRTIDGKSSGKWYWEITATGGTGTANTGGLGILESAMPNNASYIGAVPSGLSFGYGSGTYYLNWAGAAVSGQPPANSAVSAGIVYMFALDMDSGRFWAGQNGSWYNGGNPGSALNPAAGGITGTVYPGVTLYASSTDSFTANFGGSAFNYSVPAGFNPGVYGVPTTWDPAWSVAGALYGSGNRTVSGSSPGTKNARTLVGRKTGKYYWEITATGGDGTSNYGGLGILESAMPNSASYIGSVASGLSFGYGSGTYYSTWAGVTVSGEPPPFSAVNTGTVYMFALDMNAGTFWAGQNGTWYNAGDPASVANPAATGITGTVYPGVTLYSGSIDSFAANFGSAPFAYPVPAGFGAGFY